MALVTYQGDHAAVVVPVTASVSVEAEWGKPVEVPDELAKNLLTSKAWCVSSEKKAKKAASTDTVSDADDNEKGAN